MIVVAVSDTTLNFKAILVGPLTADRAAVGSTQRSTVLPYTPHRTSLAARARPWALWLLPLWAASVISGCKPQKAREVQPGAVSGTAQPVGKSWDVCDWLGPGTERTGIFGSDLGFAVSVPGADPSNPQLTLLFGDTWASAADACNYPVLKNDDFAARIPASLPAQLLPPGQPAAGNKACDTIQYTLGDASDPTSWRRIRLFPDAADRDNDRVLDTGMLRTPLTAFTDGAHMFAIYFRDQYARCNSNAECPGGSVCSADSSYTGKRIGGCTPQLALSSDAAPVWCRDNTDCMDPSLCTDLDQGVCVATEPFIAAPDGAPITPDWYQNDPRRGLESVLHIASAFWPDRPEDFASGFRWATNKFLNVTGRTVTHFDPEHPEANDYKDGVETLLLWGRPAFTGYDGFQSLPFFAYQPLAGLLDEAGNIAWAPRFFAGYDAEGNALWSTTEADAKPIYGVDENLTKLADGTWTFDWQLPEFDYVNQFSMLWVEQLSRWVMFYGGELPGANDPTSGTRPRITHAQAVPGAIHMRAARHPFGRANAAAPAADGFGLPKPVLTRADIKDKIACDEEAETVDCTNGLHGQPGSLWDNLTNSASELSPGDFLSASAKCVMGTVALDAQYSVGSDSGGHLYGTAFIPSWTQDITGALPDVPKDEPVVELYWNVSTWNPYSVLLMKTQLKASDVSPTASE
ncbi:MAG: hypothetical protein RL701_2923 [Pseudomonadota bacterium]